MDALRISLFGTPRLVCHGGTGERKLTRAVQGLLAYLLLHRERSHSRETLAGILWGERSEERARACLSTALWRLRAALEPEPALYGRYLSTRPRGEVAFNGRSDYWLDVAIFEQAANTFLAQPVDAAKESDAQALDQALKLYTSDLLEGFYDEWAIRERERLRGLYVESLVRLMRYYESQAGYAKALVCAQQVLAFDPLHEEIHRALMRLYVADGQRTQALRQYERCREILMSELAIPPMPETQELYAEIASSDGPRPSRWGSGTRRSDLEQVVRQLRIASLRADELREQVRDAIQFVEWLADETEGRRHELTVEFRPATLHRDTGTARRVTALNAPRR